MIDQSTQSFIRSYQELCERAPRLAVVHGDPDAFYFHYHFSVTAGLFGMPQLVNVSVGGKTSAAGEVLNAMYVAPLRQIDRQRSEALPDRFFVMLHKQPPQQSHAEFFALRLQNGNCDMETEGCVFQAVKLSPSSYSDGDPLHTCLRYLHTIASGHVEALGDKTIYDWPEIGQPTDPLRLAQFLEISVTQPGMSARIADDPMIL